MKNVFKYIIFAAAAVIPASCARTVPEGANEANQRYLNAWLKVNGITESQKAGRGIYVLDKTTTESVVEVKSEGFAIVNYRTTDLEGNITSYSDKETAELLGEYNPAGYYGPQVWLTTPETIRAGLLDGLSGMKLGEFKRFLIPSWLMSYENFTTEAEFLDQTSENSNTIYEVTVEDFTMDINQWQFSKMVQKFNETDFYDGAFRGTDIEDTTGVGYGIFYKGIEEIPAEKEFSSDTTIYINYIGKLLNGLIFDTNIEKVAKDNNLYKSGSSYGPTPVQWGEKYSDITLDGSEVISGFAMTLWQMNSLKSGSKGLGMFYSDLGYGYSGSSSIPGYAPLIFEIEIVDEPED